MAVSSSGVTGLRWHQYRCLKKAQEVESSRMDEASRGDVKYVVNSKRTESLPPGKGCRVRDSWKESEAAEAKLEAPDKHTSRRVDTSSIMSASSALAPLWRKLNVGPSSRDWLTSTCIISHVVSLVYPAHSPPREHDRLGTLLLLDHSALLCFITHHNTTSKSLLDDGSHIFRRSWGWYLG